MRYWRVAGVLGLIAAEALLYGYTYPFFSLALERLGLPNWLIGLNASLAGIGIFIVGPFLPRLIDRIGIKGVVAGQFAISLASFAVLLVADHVAVWFVARFVMGTCFSSLWTTTEIWLNGVVDDRQRGRIIGASGTLYAAFQFLGPVLLARTGVVGALPIWAAIVPLAIGLVVALSIPPAVGEAEDEDLGTLTGLRSALGLAGTLIAFGFLAGVGETAMQSLLPIYGLSYGLDDAASSYLVAVFSLGEAVLVAALGVLADRWGRARTLNLCTALSVVTMLALPFAMEHWMARTAVLFLSGGVISGLYTLGVILIGSDFRGSRLVTVSTGFAMSYSAGSIIGSTPVGAAMDLVGPQALPLCIALGFLALGIFLALRRPDAEPA
jgi:MFS family permease